jgi:hypothetical protein
MSGMSGGLQIIPLQGFLLDFVSFGPRNLFTIFTVSLSVASGSLLFLAGC